MKQTRISISNKNGQVTDIIKETTSKNGRITRTRHHVYSKSERLSQEEYEILTSEKKFHVVTGKTQNLVITKLNQAREFFYSDWFKNYTSAKKQFDTVKQIDKCIKVLEEL